MPWAPAIGMSVVGQHLQDLLLALKFLLVGKPADLAQQVDRETLKRSVVDRLVERETAAVNHMCFVSFSTASSSIAGSDEVFSHTA